MKIKNLNILFFYYFNKKFIKVRIIEQELFYFFVISTENLLKSIEIITTEQQIFYF